MPDFLKQHWRLCVLLVLVAAFLILPRVGQWLGERTTRHTIAEAQRLRDDAAAAETRAREAETKAAALAGQLAAKEAEATKLAGELAETQSRLQQARGATRTARVDYEKVFAVPIPSDAAVDIRMLCAELAKSGFPCEAKPQR